jgi:anti-sigma factor RsiW
VTCREFAEFIGDYLTGDLVPEQRRSFEDHLVVCDNCRRYLTHYQQAIELGRRAFSDPDAAVPGEVPEDLVQAILSARQRR